MARPRAFDRELRLATAGLEPQAVSRLLAQFARQELAKVQASGEAPQHYVRSVNGRIGTLEESVIPPGPIVHSFNALPEVAQYALAFAKERSPVRSGRFKNSWFVMVNGRQIANLEEIPLDGELILTNDQPYSRKIEVGHMKMRVPPGIVEDTRQAVMRRFGNIVAAQKRFIPLQRPYILKRGSQRRGRADKDRSGGRELTYPALVVSLRF